MRSSLHGTCESTPAPLLERGPAAPQRIRDAESRAWVARLRGIEPVRRYAITELHEHLCREARFEIRRRATRRPELSRSDLDDLAVQAADDAVMAVLRKLGDYRGDSHFLTWARRFAQLEAPVSIRRRLGRDRLAPADTSPAGRERSAPDCSPPDLVETRMLLQEVTELIRGQLTQRQRVVLIAIAVNGEKPATLAAELATSTGAVYKTLHDARRKLKAQLAVS